MNVKSWQEILNEYTRVFENCRYDHITKDAETYIADIMSTDHQMDIDKLYRSFGTCKYHIILMFVVLLKYMFPYFEDVCHHL